MNTLSDIARWMVWVGLNCETTLSTSQEIFDLLKEVFSVPEKPDNYNPTRIPYEDQVGLLVTGGLDSTVLYFRAIKQFPDRVKAFYIDIGQPYAEKEKKALKELGIEFNEIKVNDFIGLESRYWKHIIPARNFFFLSLVAERLKGGRIWFGAVDGEMPKRGGDKSKTFLKMVNRLFRRLPYPVKVETPLARETKTDLVRWWKKNLPLYLLDKTVTCFSSEEGHCGRCQACLRKYIAYANNGLTLQTNTDVWVGCQEFIQKYKTVMGKALRERDFSHYSEKRCKQTLRAIRRLEGQHL